MSKFTLPHPLLEEMAKGRVVLFLGAGASLGAMDGKGNEAPSTNKLASMLAEHFFKGQGIENSSLDYVSRLIQHHYSASHLQDYIREVLVDLKPTRPHLILPQFQWQGIVTTNYDLLVERAYEQAGRSLAVFRTNVDTNALIDDQTTIYLKLHGCIDRIGPENPPLILTQDHFLHYREGREALFSRFTDWSVEYTLLFIGFSFSDWNFATIIDEISRNLKGFRSKYYAVRPNISDLERPLWQEKRIELITARFDEFMDELNEVFPKNKRVMVGILPIHNPIESRLKIRDVLPSNIKELLESAEYVHENISWKEENDLEPRDFYRGVDLGWKAIRENLDVSRSINKNMLNEVILKAPKDKSNVTELYVIQGAAGEGKTIFIRRLAFEAARSGALCLFGTGLRSIEPSQIQELYILCNERIFLFIDDAPDHVYEIENLIRYSRKERIPITLITTTRYNEYQTSEAERLDSIVNDFIELEKLSRTEIESLVGLLEKHKALGILEPLSEAERISIIQDSLESQLLPALYQATLGKRFEEIIMDEYNSIRSSRAKHLYRAVSALHRLRIPVRSGLIARAFNIRFEDFEQELFQPLNHIIFARREHGEFVYRTRHPEIARIIFNRAFDYPESRFNEYIELMSRLNLGFASDYEAFRKIVQYRSVRELGLDNDQVNTMYETAFKSATSSRQKAHILQQEALYAMNVDNDFDWADRLLTNAIALEDRSSSIRHSLAELRVRQSEAELNFEEASGFWEEALALARDLRRRTDPISRKLGLMTIIKAHFSEIKWYIKLSRLDDVRKAIEIVELNLQEGKREYNDDGSFSNLEATFAELIGSNEEVGRALRVANDQNPSNLPVAQRLAKWCIKNNLHEEAIKVIRAALDSAPNNQQLHFQFAQMLREIDPKSQRLVMYHFGQSFNPGDQNYEAQFWFARYAFEFGNIDQKRESREIFDQLRANPMSYKTRVKVRDWSTEQGVKIRYSGVVEVRRYNDGFIRREGEGDRIYVHKDNIPPDVWALLERNRRVEFSIGFNFGGPIATDISLT